MFLLSPGQTSVAPDIPGSPFAWYRADTLVTSGSSVTTWTDKSGNGRHLVEGTAATLLTADINGHDAVDFDGTNDILQLGSQTLAQDFHVFSVLKFNSHGNNDRLLFFGQTADLFLKMGTGGPDGEVQWQADSTNKLDFGTSYALLGAVADGGSSSLKKNEGTPVTVSNNSNGLTDISIGGGAATGFNDMTCAEMAIYSTEQTSGALTAIESYFGTRYGLF